MQHSRTHLRTRPISARHLRVFDAVARHLSFSAAAEELALTQSTLSRQIQALEREVGVDLFLRHTRSVELTSAGTQLLMAVSQSLPRIDNAVRQIRQGVGRRTVSVAAINSFISMWLIPRLGDFREEHPDIDIRIENPNVAVDVDLEGVDLTQRYGPMQTMPAHAVRLFGEQLTTVLSPRLLERGPRLKVPADVAQFTLVEPGDALPAYSQWITWRRWFDEHGLQKLQPKGWLYFDQGHHMMMQAVVAGQGVALGRLPMVAKSLMSGDLIEPLPKMRIDSPFAYWLMMGRRSAQRPEVRSFYEWLIAQSKITRQMIGEAPDPDTNARPR